MKSALNGSRSVAAGLAVLTFGLMLSFKRANPWLAALKFLPYTVLYRRGQRVDEFAASKGSYLIERVETALGVSP